MSALLRHICPGEGENGEMGETRDRREREENVGESRTRGMRKNEVKG
jgi:hypothetical protein